MKPGKLYIKIFISFVLILFVTELMIFAFFLLFAGRHFRDRTIRYTNAQALLAKSWVEDTMLSHPDTNPADNADLKELIQRLGESYDAKVWLSDADGRSVVQSFEGPLSPETIRLYQGSAADMGSYRVYRSHRNGMTFFITIPVVIRGDAPAALNLLYEHTSPRHLVPAFALGLLIIGIVVALLLVPVARRITGPVKRLKQSVDRLAEGELSHRATVEGRDEIGDLGRSFNRMAETMERMIQNGRELTANVSHELRTPLSRIRMSAELLREKMKNEESRDLGRHLKQIDEEIEELDRLIGDILVLSRLNILKTPRHPEPINLSPMIEQLAERFSAVAELKGVHVNLHLPERLTIRADRESLQIAFSNLLDNAVKYADREGKVRVEAKGAGEHVEVRFINSFMTLPDGELERIFEPFYRAESGSGEGFGLGLAITKTVIEAHGGRIQAMNGEEGLILWVALPVSFAGETA